MNKQQAIRQVAHHAAGLIQAGTFEEATGVMDSEEISDADAARLSEAVEIVVMRLHRMGRD